MEKQIKPSMASRSASAFLSTGFMLLTANHDAPRKDREEIETEGWGHPSLPGAHGK